MIYVFGEYSLDEQRYQLRWRGDELELEPKVFEVLAYLMRERARVVPKAELLEQLWPEQIVGEWSLTRCISVARKALQDTSAEQRIIQTLYGRGYRFVAPVEERSDEPLHPASVASAPVDAARPALIGRERPLAELQAGLDAALSGRGRVLLVTGETGIGKTRLAEELAARAEACGAAVRIGRCWETEGAPAYWAWIQILRSEARARGSQALRALIGTSASEIVGILPELRDEFPNLPKPAPMDPRQARFRLFDAVTHVVKRAAQERALVLIFEDLHRADPASLRLLEFLAREVSGARILVVGTLRDDELARTSEHSRIIAELARASSAQYVPLDGLSLEDVGRFVESATGEAPNPSVAEALHRQTNGNPFFLAQVVPALAEEGLLQSWSGDEPFDLELPRGVRQAILGQLDGLSAFARRVLEAAAVQGRSFSLGVLEAALEADRDALTHALSEAVRSGIALEDPERPGRYRFTHVLVRDTLYAELPAADRAAWHRRLGDALEGRTGGEGPGHLAELSHHYSEARAAGGAKKALDYSIAAARWAAERLAYEEAVGYYERGLDLLELQDSVDEASRCDLLIDLGEAQLRATDATASRATLQRAAELARGLHEPERLARAAVATAQTANPLVRGVVEEQVVSLLEVALARLSERDSALRARLLVSLVLALYWAEDQHERCTRLCEDALAMARRVGDPQTLLFIQSAVISARWGPDLIEERAQLATEAIRLGETTGVKEQILDARVQRLVAWFELGRMDAVDQELAEISRITAELHHTEADEYLPWFQAIRAIMSGRFDVGEKLASQFLDDVQKRGDETGLLGFSLQFILLRWLQGRCDEILEAVQHLSERHPAVSTFRATLTRIYCDLGRFDDARRELERLTPRESCRFAKKIGWFTIMALLSESAALLGDQRRCEALYAELTPYSRRHAASGAGYMGSVSRYLGLLATELGRWDMAERHFTVALEMETHIGARATVAWTQFYYARLLHLRGDAPERAEPLTQRALENAAELGLSRLTENILALDS
jgi:predicted ATPase